MCATFCDENCMNIQVGNTLLFPTFIRRRGEVYTREIFEDNVPESSQVLFSAAGNRYEIVRTIKPAIYGRVDIGIILDGEDNALFRTDQKVAIKVIYQDSLAQMYCEKAAENPITEISAMQFIGNENPNLMGQIECLFDDGNIYSIMRLCSEGEFLDYVMNDGPLDEGTARQMVRNVLNGLERLQQLGIGHRDFSAENLLIDSLISDDFQYVIIDYGMCARCPRRNEIADTVDEEMLTASSFKHVPRRQSGKAQYMAPEVYDTTLTHINPMLCDIWALGVVLFVALSGCFPMENSTENDFKFQYIVGNRLQELVDRWQLPIPPAAVDLIQKLLQRNPAERLTIAQIRDHPWMNQ